jgi:hypothetical protein
MQRPSFPAIANQPTSVDRVLGLSVPPRLGALPLGALRAHRRPVQPRPRQLAGDAHAGALERAAAAAAADRLLPGGGLLRAARLVGVELLLRDQQQRQRRVRAAAGLDARPRQQQPHAGRVADAIVELRFVLGRG